MPKTTSPVEQIQSLRDSLSKLEAKINDLKAERDAHVQEHRAVYKKEREYADKIKALQTEVAPIWAELKELQNLLAGRS